MGTPLASDRVSVTVPVSIQTHEELLSLFIQNLKIDRGAQKHTIDSYLRDLKQFLGAHSNSTLTSLSQKEIEAYLHSLFEQKQSAKTVARKLSSIRQFFLFLCREEHLELNPTENIQSPKTKTLLPDTLSIDEVQILLKKVEAGGLYKTELKNVYSLRDFAMVLLLYATGIRVSELVDLKMEKCDLRNCLIRVDGKGGKERLVPFFEKVAHILENYLENARPQLTPKTSHLFLNKNGESLTRQAIFLLLQNYAQHAGLKKNISPHTLRHSYASHLLQSGMHVRYLQTLLGHCDLSTTQIYTHINPEHLKKSYKKYHPRSGR